MGDDAPEVSSRARRASSRRAIVGDQPRGCIPRGSGGIRRRPRPEGRADLRLSKVPAPTIATLTRRTGPASLLTSRGQSCPTKPRRSVGTAMQRPLIILGTGGNALDILDLVESCRALAGAGFLDDARPEGERVAGLPVLGRLGAARRLAENPEAAFVNAIGSEASHRERLAIVAGTGLDPRASPPWSMPGRRSRRGPSSARAPASMPAPASPAGSWSGPMWRSGPARSSGTTR